MPWVVYDPDDGTYLCQEEHGKGAPDDLSDGLWQKDVTKATGFDTFGEAASAFAEIDVEEWLPQIRPIWVERAPPAPVRRPWDELTFEEKMEQIEEDFNESIARRVQRTMLETEANLLVIDSLSSTGRATSSEPAKQYLPRSKIVDYSTPLGSHHISKADRSWFNTHFDEMMKKVQLPTALFPKPPTPRPSPPLERPLSNPIVDADYASLELRLLSQIVSNEQRNANGRKEEEGFQSLHCIVVHACCRGDAPRRELPDDQGSAGSGKRAGGEGGGKG